MANTDSAIIAWWGSSDPPSGHPLQGSAAALVCTKEEQIKTLISVTVPTVEEKSKITVVDIFNPHGTSIHVAGAVDVGVKEGGRETGKGGRGEVSRRGGEINVQFGNDNVQVQFVLVAILYMQEKWHKNPTK